jgi:hypothetical protein
VKFLCLEHLAGPGDSVDENFEIMNLELIKAILPQYESFRLSAPDGGIDIYSRDTTGAGENFAFQCKAYPTFRPNLVQAVEKSIHSALSSANLFPWTHYNLVIPFVPTRNQRWKLEEVFQSANLKSKFGLGHSERYFHIVDGDELEATLFRHPSVARRFFPNLVVVTPLEQGKIVLGYPNDPSLLQVNLKFHTVNQIVPVNVSQDTKAGSLLQMLIGQLGLPVKAAVICVTKSYYDIQWSLILAGKPERVIDLEKTLPEQNVTQGATIYLRYYFSCTIGSAAHGLDYSKKIEMNYRVVLLSFFEHTVHEGTTEDWYRFNAEDYWLKHYLKAAQSNLLKSTEDSTETL